MFATLLLSICSPSSLSTISQLTLLGREEEELIDCGNETSSLAGRRTRNSSAVRRIMSVGRGGGDEYFGRDVKEEFLGS